MDEFVTIKVFAYPHEANIVAGMLQAEGIECFIKDELSIGANPLYSTALGGVKLQVKASDIERAIKLLAETGDADAQQALETMAAAHETEPGANETSSKKYGLRTMALIFAVPVLAVIIYYLISYPWELRKITSQEWCITYVIYQGESYKPNSVFNGKKMHGECEPLLFTGNEILLPGFNTPTETAEWNFDNGYLRIKSAGLHKYLYNGTYTFTVNENELRIQSPTTLIYCQHPE